MTSAVYRGHKTSNQTNKSKLYFPFQFKGRVDFSFSREEMLEKAKEYWPNTVDLIDFECVFNASAKDWFFNLTAVGFTATNILNPGVKLVWIGDAVRTFKPDSVMTVHVSFRCCLD